MNTSPSLEDFIELLSSFEVCVEYTPLPDEVDFRSAFFLADGKQVIRLPYRNDIDPFSYAYECAAQYRTRRAYVLVPGRQFDVYGVRRGRGGGWYDKFLSALPKSWLRIGVGYEHDVSRVPLVAQPWDEPMDWIMSCEGSSWNVYETHARDR